MLTHGHEDHVGALPYVLRELAAVRVPPVYGGPLTVELVRSKLDEHRLLEVGELVQVEPGEPFAAGPFTVETVRLSHSIPDSCGVALSCALGTALVTGDYKFDQTPSTASRPTWRGWRSSGATGCCFCAAIRRTWTVRESPRRNRAWARTSRPRSRTARAGSW